MNCKKTRVNKLLVIFILVICVIMLGSIVIVPQNNLKGETQAVNDVTKKEDQIANMTEQLYPFTNQEIVNDMHINNYAEDYYAKKATVKYDAAKVKYKMTVTGNDDIINFVPKEMFTKIRLKKHFGKGYGFIVDTVAKLNNEALLSTVMLVKIDISSNYLETMSHILVAVSPIFQADFAYIKRDNTKLFSLDPQNKDIFTNSYSDNVIMEYQASGEDFVVPVPTRELGVLKFKQHNRLQLSDPINMLSLYNLNELNPGDEGYNPYNDYGCFISQIDFAYEGNYIVPDSANYNEIKDLFVQGVSTTFDIAVLPQLEKISSLKRVLKAAPYIGAVTLAADVAKLVVEPQFEKVKEEKKFSYKANYTNRIDQIENGGLQKDAAIVIQPNDTNNRFLIGVGGKAIFDYQIVKPELLETNAPAWDTIFANLFEADIYSVTTTGTLNNKSSTKLIGNVRSSFSHNVVLDNNSSSKTPKVVVDKINLDYNKVNVFPNSESIIKLKPEFSGNFKLQMSRNPYAKFAVYEINDYVNIDKNYNFGEPYAQSTMINNCATIENIFLNCDKSYCVVTDLKNNISQDNICTRYDNLRLSVDYLSKELQFGNNLLELSSNEEIVVFSTIKNLYYNLNVLSNNIEDIILLDSRLNVVPDNEYKNNKLQIKSKYSGEILFVKIKLKTNADKNINIFIDDEMHISFANIDNINNNINKSLVVNTTSTISLPTPQKNGYNFEGWWTTASGTGIQINQSNIFYYAVPDLVLYARWTIIEYTIQYIVNGGTAVNNELYTVEYSKVLNKDITKNGYVFAGWYDNPQLIGNKVEVIGKGSYGNKIFYAKWVKERLQVELDVNSQDTDGLVANISQSACDVKYGYYYQLPVPTLDGFKFDGWFYDNQQLTYSSGRSMAPFNFEENVVLQAHWAREIFYFKIDMGKEWNELWLGQKGKNENKEYFVTTNKSESGIEFSLGMCPNCYIIDQLLKNDESSEIMRKKLSKTGYYYTHMSKEANSNEVFCWKDINAFDLFDSNKTFKVYACHEKEKYNINIKKNGTTVEIIQVEFDELLLQNGKYLPQLTTSFEDNKTGYHLDGYEVADCLENKKFENGKFAIGNIFAFEKMPDLSDGFPTYDGNYAIYLTAHFTPNVYNVVFDNVVEEIEPIQVIYDGIYTYDNALPIPEKIGYNFDGWSLEIGGDLISNNLGYVEKWYIASDCALYANWSPKQYTITLNANGGRVQGNDKIYYNIESPTFTLPNAKKAWYNFEGWMLNENIMTEIETGTYGDFEVQAIWKQEKESIIQLGDNIITKNGLTIDFSLSGLLVAQTFIIEDTVDEITFTGRLVTMSYKAIKISPRNSPLTIKLKKFNVYGHYNTPAIDASDCYSLHLIIDGKNFMGSGNKTLTTVDKSSAAIIGNNIDISGVNNGDLHLQGGAGVGYTGTTNGANGLSGAHGIWATNLYISNLTMKAVGGVGYAGYTGGNGGNGGNGIYASKITVENSNVTAVAGNGGNAGEGGHPGSAGKPVIGSVSGIIERQYGTSGTYNVNASAEAIEQTTIQDCIEDENNYDKTENYFIKATS